MDAEGGHQASSPRATVITSACCLGLQFRWRVAEDGYHWVNSDPVFEPEQQLANHS